MNRIFSLRTPWPWLLFGLATALLLHLCAQELRPDPEANLEPKQIQAELEQLTAWTNALDQDGLPGLWQAIEASSQPAPRMDSAVCALLRADQHPHLAELLQARRDFGLACALALDAQAAVLIHQPANADERKQQVEQLQRFSAWFQGTVGYGNYRLAVRAANLSSIPLAYLVIDLNVPLADLRSSLAYLLQYAKHEDLVDESTDQFRQYRIAVLEQDANDNFIGSELLAVSDPEESIAYAWSRKAKAASDWLRQHGGNSADLPADLRPFPDSSGHRPHTTTAEWELNYLIRLVNQSPSDPNVHAVLFAAEFREVIGHWPTEPPPHWREGVGIDGDDPIAAAMDHAWMAQRDTICPAGTLSRLYRAVRDGTLMDRETQSRLSWERDQQRRQQQQQSETAQ